MALKGQSFRQTAGSCLALPSLGAQDIPVGGWLATASPSRLSHLSLATLGCYFIIMLAGGEGGIMS